MIKKIELACFLLFFCNSYIFSLDVTVPRMAESIIAEDFDNDSDLDIVISHKVTWGNTFPRLSYLENSGGIFTVIDTSISFCGGGALCTLNINNDDFVDFASFGSDFSSDDPYRFLKIFTNSGDFSFTYYDLALETNDVIKQISSGYLNDDTFQDIIVMSQSDDFWGRMFNYNGSLEQPQYFQLDFNCSDIKCAKLNNDDSYDVVVSGDNTNIYYSMGNNFILSTINHEHFNTDIEIIDYDNDGDNDIIGCANVMGVATPLYFHQNQGWMDIALVDTVVVNPGLSTVLYNDMNQDGFFDVIGFNEYGLYVFMNNGFNDFGDADFYHIPDMMQLFYSMVVKDLDSNGSPDIALVAGTSLMTFYNNGDGNLSSEPDIGSAIEENELEIPQPQKTELSRNYPNPFNPETNIEFSISEEAEISLSIYNIRGQLVKTLINSNIKKGRHQISWNGKNESGQTVSSGIYYCKLKNDNMETVRKMILIK